VKLPNASDAIIPREKLRDYVLSESHPVGRFKAAYFASLGYSRDQWQALERDIRNLLHEDARESVATVHGRKYEVRGEIVGPNGRAGKVMTVWIILESEELPRFITAYPGG